MPTIGPSLRKMDMKFLIAVDGSKASQAAVKYTVSLFKKYTQKGAVDDYLREGADTHLAWAIRFLNKANVAHDMAIKFGHPSAQILKEAKVGGFDMIIMSTKGRSAWGDTLMGSVAHRVASASKVPVLLIQP